MSLGPQTLIYLHCSCFDDELIGGLIISLIRSLKFSNNGYRPIFLSRIDKLDLALNADMSFGFPLFSSIKSKSIFYEGLSTPFL